MDRRFPDTYESPFSSMADRTRKQEQNVAFETEMSSFAQPSVDNFKSIICPFLSTLVHEGALPVQTSYSRELLEKVTVDAGLAPETAEDHVADNFAFTPSGFQDIFNLEGAPNEHATSTGINDCATTYSNCRQSGGGLFCDNSTRSCSVPNAARFEETFRALDVNFNNRLSLDELELNAESVRIRDVNPFGLGSIRGAHGLIIQIFTDGGGNRLGGNLYIEKDSLWAILMDRRFPDTYESPFSSMADRTRKQEQNVAFETEMTSFVQPSVNKNR